jgi:hypothetical protein
MNQLNKMTSFQESVEGLAGGNRCRGSEKEDKKHWLDKMMLENQPAQSQSAK